jgi:tripartite-type tricarboxylate transporter receptor subunit TctC
MRSESRKLVVGFSSGSASEQIARVLAAALERELDCAIAIELHPGNNGADAACEVARAKPDGKTLFIATLGTHALAPHLNSKLPYDALRDFSCVSLLTTAPLVLACHSSIRVTSASELIELAREHPGVLTYGTSALGGAPHVAAELLCALAGVEMKHVQYTHTNRLYEDLEAGRIALTFNNIMSLLPRCQSGVVHALAVTSATRSPVAEHLPTLAELGLPGYDMANWLGVVAPRATPHTTIEVLSRAISEALHSDAVYETLSAAGVTPCGSTPAAFADFMEREITRWGPVVARFRDMHAAAAHQEHES